MMVQLKLTRQRSAQYAVAYRNGVDCLRRPVLGLSRTTDGVQDYWSIDMELPRRARGDELLEPGAMARLRARLRRVAPAQDLTTVIACAFDHRTRMLPFIFADT